MADFYVYVMSNLSKAHYIGMTNNVERRVWEHKFKTTAGFTKRYNLTMLVHMETFPDPGSAIAREKELKGWRREKKMALILENNPCWHDLAFDRYVG